MYYSIFYYGIKTKNMTDNYTPLPVAKWTIESIQQIHRKMFAKYVNKLFKSKYTEEEQINRLRPMLAWFTHIEQLCLSKDITVKKK